MSIFLLGQTASTFFTVAITLERFVVIYWPLKAQSICTIKTTWRSSAIIFVFSSLSVLPHYFAFHVLETVESENGTTMYAPQRTEFGKLGYKFVYEKWMFPILNYTIPFTILIILNAFIYLQVNIQNSLLGYAREQDLRERILRQEF